ncbi:hypothetical protein [Brachybacterium tyrofermentans]|uniref:hypothetical protein n=1 Tax=Brachybacterium tyrofermentans TaxID=47848 RepID=UPI003FD4E755
MTTAAATSTDAPATAGFGRHLLRLYLARFVFAVLWAGLLFVVAPAGGLVLTALLVIYPLFDAAAVGWQLRSPHREPGSPIAEQINVAVSVIVAIALGVSVTFSAAAALAVWGLWAIGSGLPQLIAAIRNRRSGGQVPQMLSGGISVLAGSAFFAQGLAGSEAIGGVGGYAILGGVFFLLSAIRLALLLRKSAA